MSASACTHPFNKRPVQFALSIQLLDPPNRAVFSERPPFRAFVRHAFDTLANVVGHAGSNPEIPSTTPSMTGNCRYCKTAVATRSIDASKEAHGIWLRLKMFNLAELLPCGLHAFPRVICEGGAGQMLDLTSLYLVWVWPDLAVASVVDNAQAGFALLNRAASPTRLSALRAPPLLHPHGSVTEPFVLIVYGYF